MTVVDSSALTSFAVPILGACVVAVLLVKLQGEYEKSYVEHWALAWTAFAFSRLITAEASVASHALPERSAWPVLAAVAAEAIAFAQLGWFAFGVQELTHRRPVRIRTARYALLMLASCGALAGFAASASSESFADGAAAAAAMRGIASAIAFCGCGAALWRVHDRGRGVALGLVAVTFAVCGVVQVRHVVEAAGLFTRVEPAFGTLDFLVQFVLAIGLIACVLEDEREAVAAASVEVEHMAYHDALTGLPNRPLFFDRLILSIAQAQREKQKIGVFFLDLDHFKDVNDSLSHSTGDQLLRGVAERLQRCVREGDTVARFGGDEFTLLIPRLGRAEDAAVIARKIVEMLRLPFSIHGHELFAPVSVGISLYPSDGTDAETLVRNADAAMYRAKEAGRDGYCFYAPAMNESALERLALENKLRKALANGELLVYYQPVLDATSVAIVGFEALARWKHPDFGLLLPSNFIGSAESSGLIVPIGEWVLREACAQVKVWQQRLGRDLRASVNLSARQFAEPDLIHRVRSALDATGLAPESLELEITESSAMGNADNTIQALRELKALGVRIAMDDFGTGYSSLTYLRRFPVDTLKLDHGFVRDVTDDRTAAAIVVALVALSRELGLQVVAEGVETAEQLAFLRRHGCDRIQGFFFSAPMSVHEVDGYFAESTPKQPVGAEMADVLDTNCAG